MHTDTTLQPSINHSNAYSIPYRPEIDGLRAIAIISVVLYHAHVGLRAGLVGVDVFYVISGYLITALLLREWDGTAHIRLFEFYARRVRRLFPALILVVISTLIASAFLLTAFDMIREIAHSAAASLLFVGNFFFQLHTGGYFSPSAAHFPLLNMWSLGTEEQFYLLWPLTLLIVLHWRRQAAFKVLTGLGLASLVCAEVLILVNPTAAFYEMPARFWELAAGGLIALSPAQKLTDGRLLSTLGVLIVIAAVIFPIHPFPGIGALPAVAGAALLIYAVHGSIRLGWTGRVLHSRPMVFFGLISYSLYLWHWPLLSLWRMTHPGPTPIAITLLICAVAVLLAWLSYRFIEQPFRRRRPGDSGSKIVASGLAAVAALAFASVALGNLVHAMYPATGSDLASRTASDFPPNRFACNYMETHNLSDFPRAACIYAKGKPIRVAIWGDSHALAWEPFAWALARRKGVAEMSYTRDGCQPALGYGAGPSYLAKRYCREFNRLTFNSVNDIQTLIFAAMWPQPNQTPGFYAKFQSTLAQLAPRIPHIILLGPTPYLQESVPHCMATHDLSACAINYKDYHAGSEPIRERLQFFASEYPNVQYIELANFFCNSQTCPAMKDGYGLYWDTNHVSTTAARAFSSQYFAAEKRGEPHAQHPPAAQSGTHDHGGTGSVEERLRVEIAPGSLLRSSARMRSFSTISK